MARKRSVGKPPRDDGEALEAVCGGWCQALIPESLTLVTRNVKHVERTDVECLNPFTL